MHDATARGHELEIASLYGALIAGEVFVVNGSGEEVCDGLLTTMGVWGFVSVSIRRDAAGVEVLTIWKASTWRNCKVVEHEERTEVSQFRSPYTSPHSCARTFRLFNGEERFGDLARRGCCERLIRWYNGKAAEHGGAVRVGHVRCCVARKEGASNWCDSIGYACDSREHRFVVVDCYCNGDECD